MLTLDHPFICKMVKSMKNASFCFLLMEFVNGKNLDEYLSTRLIKKKYKRNTIFCSKYIFNVRIFTKKIYST